MVRLDEEHLHNHDDSTSCLDILEEAFLKTPDCLHRWCPEFERIESNVRLLKNWGVETLTCTPPDDTNTNPECISVHPNDDSLDNTSPNFQRAYFFYSENTIKWLTPNGFKVENGKVIPYADVERDEL